MYSRSYQLRECSQIQQQALPPFHILFCFFKLKKVILSYISMCLWTFQVSAMFHDWINVSDWSVRHYVTFYAYCGSLSDHKRVPIFSPVCTSSTQLLTVQVTYQLTDYVKNLLIYLEGQFDRDASYVLTSSELQQRCDRWSDRAYFTSRCNCDPIRLTGRASFVSSVTPVPFFFNIFPVEICPAV